MVISNNIVQVLALSKLLLFGLLSCIGIGIIKDLAQSIGIPIGFRFRLTLVVQLYRRLFLSYLSKNTILLVRALKLGNVGLTVIID